MDMGWARNGGRLLHGLADSYSRIKKFYRGKTIAQMDLPDIDLEGRVVIMTGADRGLGRAMSLGLAKKGARLVLASPFMDGLNDR